MGSLVTGMIMLAAFLFFVRKDARSFLNALLLIGAGIFLFIGIAVITREITMLQLVLTGIVLGMVPLTILFIAVLLLIDGIILITKEGFRFKNLLPIFLSAAMAGGIVCVVLTISEVLAKSRWLISLFWLITIMDIYGSCTFAALLLYAKIYSFLPKNLNCDYIIVHGCGLAGGERVTPLLKGRIDEAVEIYKRADNSPKLVLSGGQGADEKISEAKAMQNYLKETGFPIENTILEEQSRTTYENLKNVRDMLEPGEEKKKYIFVTNNYHVFRTSLFARKLKIHAEGVGCKTAIYYWPTAFIREYIAIMVRYRWITVFVFLIWLLLAIYSYLPI